MTDSRAEVLLTDLPSHVVDGDLADGYRADHWRVVDYRLEALGEGRALIGEDRPRGPVTIRLGVSGRYRISFITRYAEVRAKLTGERCFRSCPSAEGRQWYGLVRSFDAEETFWRDADLTDRDLLLDGRGETILLAIRLAPVDAPPDDDDVKWPMAITNDANDLNARPHLVVDDNLEECEVVDAESSVRLLIYGAVHGDICYHPTEVGTQFGSVDGETAPSEGARNLARYRKWGVNPSRAMAEYAHQRGWEVFAYVRGRGYADAWPADTFTPSRFYRAHSELRLQDRDGTPVHGLSVAYPQVRAHLCRLYAELRDFGFDGVSPCFIRSVPIVLYEPAMVEGFEREHGLDPRDVPEDDPRWLDYIAKIVTGFMRELKDAIGASCRLAPFVHGTETLNRRYGMDIATWVAEGIVDDLFITGHTYDRFGLHRETGPEDLDFGYFNALPGRDRVRLWPMFYMWQNFHEDPKRHYDAFTSYMDSGADGYCLWDAGRRRTDRAGNFWDWGTWPRPEFQQPSRLMGKYEMLRWCGYAMNRHTQLESH